MTRILYSLGIQTINKSYTRSFFKNICRVDQNIYIIYQKYGFSVGFKTNYCGVNTYIPVEFKNYWVSDHHLLSMVYGFGRRYVSLVPYKGELYCLHFNRVCLPSMMDFDDFFKILKEKYCFLDNLGYWINLFTFNNDGRILNRQGMVYTEITSVDRNVFNELTHSYKSSCELKNISIARKKLIDTFEHVLASITI